MVGRVRFLAFFILLASLTAFAQEARNPTLRKSSKNLSLRAPNVSRNKARIICPIFENSRYPRHGLGIKVGDPLAVTYKYYPSEHWAFAVDAGKPASGLYSKYYRNGFNDNLPDSLQYLSHKVTSDWMVESKLLYQFSMDKLSPGVQAYAGLGWQWKNTTLSYNYIYYKDDFEPTSPAGQFTDYRFTYGPVAVVGFEYSNFSLPVSAFIEIEGFMDAYLDPGYMRFQGGMGLRYIF